MACAPRPPVSTVSAVNGGPTTATIRTDAYRRRARRLRHVYAADPVGLQRSLADLARSCDSRSRVACGFASQTTRNYRAAVPAKAQAEVKAFDNDSSSRTTRAAEIFADMVADRMIGPILTYAARQKLIREATRMGIGRFEANLIIAAVQYRTDRAERPETDNKYGREYGPLASVLTIAAVQATIVLGAWWMMS